MASATRVQRNELVRERILEVAARLFSAQGYRATSLDDVAAELDIKRQALYYYYPRKVDILVALNKRVIDLWIAMADEVIANAPSGADRFSLLVENHFRAVAENIALVSIFTREAPAVPEAESRELRKGRRAYRATFMEAYREGVEEGRLRDIDPRVAVSLVLGAANNMIQWYSPRGQLGPTEIASAATDFLLRGYAISD